MPYSGDCPRCGNGCQDIILAGYEWGCCQHCRVYWGVGSELLWDAGVRYFALDSLYSERTGEELSDVDIGGAYEVLQQYEQVQAVHPSVEQVMAEVYGHSSLCARCGASAAGCRSHAYLFLPESLGEVVQGLLDTRYVLSAEEIAVQVCDSCRAWLETPSVEAVEWWREHVGHELHELKGEPEIVAAHWDG